MMEWAAHAYQPPSALETLMMAALVNEGGVFAPESRHSKLQRDDRSARRADDQTLRLLYPWMD